MDGIRANTLAAELIGKKIGGCDVIELIDYGKSAAVFRATRGEQIVALKVFDREIVERFGAEVQLTRIDRELRLRDGGHPNVVRIFEGGHDTATDSYFVAMEYVPEANLSARLQTIKQEDIPEIIEQLAAATKFLESVGLVHRDVKPSNMVWRPEERILTLLDLGVLGPVGETGALTDMNGRAFIGTLQYSSPEYLLRVEDDSIDGWRALTFYQIGAVLHDLIMKKALFSEFAEPYGRLVNAVQHEQPVIQSTAVPQNLIELARRCLVKKPDLRLALVNWSNFEDLQSGSKSSAKERVTNRTVMSVAGAAGDVSVIDEARQRVKLEAEVSVFLRTSIRAIRRDNSIFPPAFVVPKKDEGGILVRFDSSARHQLPNGMSLLIRCNVLDASEQVVELTGRSIEEGDVTYEISFFKGVADYLAMYSGLEDFIYTMLDAAQQQQ